MYGEEYLFRGSVADFVGAVTTYARRVVYRGTPGPYAPSDVFTRQVPVEEEFAYNITYARFTFKSRFTRHTGTLTVNSLPTGKALLVVDFPYTTYESEYEEQSLQWAWRNLKAYLKTHGWIDDEDEYRIGDSDSEASREPYVSLESITHKDRAVQEKHREVIKLSKQGLSVPQISSQVGYAESHVKRLRAIYRKRDTNDTE